MKHADDLAALNRSVICVVAGGIAYQIAAFTQILPLQILNQLGYLTLVTISFFAFTDVGVRHQLSPSNQREKLNFAVDLLAALCCLASIAILDQFVPMPNTHWEGFGLGGLMIAIVFAFLFSLFVANKEQFSKKQISLLSLGTSIAALVALSRAIPGMIQPPNALLNLNDQTYIVLEETLAQYNGFVPDVNYLRVYSSLYGWLFKSLTWIDFDDSFMMPLIVWFYNLLSLGTLLIATFIMWLSYKRRSVHFFLWSFSAIVLLASLSGKEGATSSMFSNIGWVVRFNFPFAALLCMVLVGRARRVVSRVLLSNSVGIFTGLAILNSPDYGLLFAVAVFASLIIHRVVQKRWLCYAAHLTWGFLATTVLYWVSLKVWTTGFSLDMYLSLVQKAQTGTVYDTESVAILGPHLFIFIIAFTTLFRSLYILRKRQQASVSLNANILPIVALMTAIWLLLSSIKWLTAAHPVGLAMGGFFVQAVICGGLLIAMTHLQLGDFQTLRNIRGCVRVFPSLILLGLPFAASLQTADWQVETKRLLGYANERGWAKEQDRAPAGGWTKSFLLEKGTTRHPSQWLEALYKLSDSQKNGAESIVYFGEFSNTVELLTGIQSVMPTSAPEHMRFGDYFKSQACSLIDSETTYSFIAVFGSEVPCRGLVYLGEDKSGLIGLWEEKD